MIFWTRYIGAFQKQTRSLSLTELGAYDRLLDELYATEVGLPIDPIELYRIAGALLSEEQQAVDKVVAKFFEVGPDGLLHQARAAAEIIKAKRRIEVAKENGKKGGRPSKGKPSGNPAGSKQEPSGQANHIHNTLLPSVESKEGGEASAAPPPSPPSASSPLPPSAPAAPTGLAVDKPVKKPAATKKAAQAKPAAGPLWTPPDWVPADAWASFEEMRRKAHKSIPFTDAARTLIVKELDKLRTEGSDPRRVLEQSVMNSWRGVFAVEDRRTGPRTGQQDRRQDPPKPASHDSATTYLDEQAKHQPSAPPAELLARRRKRAEA